MESFAEIERLAESLLDRKTKNFVTDAFVLARWILSEGKRLAEAEAARETPSLRPVFEKERQTLTNLEKLAVEMADEARR